MNQPNEKIKTVYAYDEDGFYCQARIAQRNPKRPNSWMVPADSTFVKPELEDGYFYQICTKGDPDSGWIAVKKPSSAEEFINIKIPHKSRTDRNNELRKLLRECVAKDSERFREKTTNNDKGEVETLSVEIIPELTAEEKKQKKENEVRSQRDSLLTQTDFLLQPDYPITAEELVAVNNYRQLLRDLPEQNGFPFNVEWPEPPLIAKSAHRFWTADRVAVEQSQRLQQLETLNLSNEDKERIKNALLQISKQANYPYEIEWPEIPEAKQE